MAKAEKGNTVKVHYTGKLKDGQVFDSSEGGDPLSFTIGSQEVIPGFEEAITGMEAGESKTAEIPVSKAYGAPKEDLILSIPKTDFPPDLEVEVGMVLTIQPEENAFVDVTVIGMDDEQVKIDGNHPLAGKDLTFDIKLLEVN